MRGSADNVETQSRICAGCGKAGLVPTVAEPKPAVALAITFRDGTPQLLCPDCRLFAPPEVPERSAPRPQKRRARR